MKRIELGLTRLCCDCSECRSFCRYLPGNLIPSDLERLIPAGEDPFVWDYQHLLADEGGCLKTATKPDGSCHWFRGGRCEVWADAPFGCAFFGCDKVQTDEEADAAAALAEDAIQTAMRDESSLYSRLWVYLWSMGRRRTFEDKALARKKHLKLLKRSVR